jgi:hypothetical protein
VLSGAEMRQLLKSIYTGELIGLGDHALLRADGLLFSTNGSAVSGDVNVSCTYNNPPNGAWVNIGVDGNQVYWSNGPSANYSGDTSKLSGGHTIDCVAYHWDDNIGGVQDGRMTNDVTVGSGPGPTPPPIPTSGRVKGTYYVDPRGN